MAVVFSELCFRPCLVVCFMLKRMYALLSHVFPFSWQKWLKKVHALCPRLLKMRSRLAMMTPQIQRSRMLKFMLFVGLCPPLSMVRLLWMNWMAIS